jgi:cytochrome c biogenesis protein CcdA
MRLPIVLGYVAGSNLTRKRSLLLTALFGAGLVLSYCLMGISLAFAGVSVHRVLHASQSLFWFFGIVLLLTGMAVAGLIGPRLVPAKWRHIAEKLSRIGAWGALPLGAISGLLLMPACPSCGAGLIVLATVATAKNLSLYGLLMFLSFGLGQALPVLAVGTFATVVKPDLIKRLRKRMCSVEQRMQLLAGNVLMVLGVYFIIVG